MEEEKFAKISVDDLQVIFCKNGKVCLEFASCDEKELGQRGKCLIELNFNQIMLLKRTLDTFIDALKKDLAALSGSKAMLEQYDPGVFRVSSIGDAKRIILTDEGLEGTDERWSKETPALVSMMEGEWDFSRRRTVVDYGCGIGRISKELCRLGCDVVGVDISEDMRRLAVEYVNDSRFTVVSPDEFDRMLDDGFKCDNACAIWVLQHCFKPADDIARIKRALKRNGGLFIVNNKESRAIPMKGGKWTTDGLDIWEMLGESFREVRLFGFPEGLGIRGLHYQCGFYRKTR